MYNLLHISVKNAHLQMERNVSEHVQYEQYLRSSFFKWLLTIFGTISFWSRCTYISSLASQYVCDRSANTNTYR